MVNTNDPYIPDIMEAVVARVNSFFQTQSSPFTVTYGKGIYSQVGADMEKAGFGDVWVWLVMPFDEIVENELYYADTVLEMIIAKKTESTYTQQQRDDLNFGPYLLPVYEKLKQEIQDEPGFLNPLLLKHKKTVLPYWGGGDVSAPGQTNLWKFNVDAVKFSNIKTQVDFKRTGTPLSNF